MSYLPSQHQPHMKPTGRGFPVAYNTVQDIIPIQDHMRSCTDILCTIIGILFSLALIITAIVLFNWDNYVKSNFATDTQGRLCGVDDPAYSYLYFADPPNIEKRLCVSKCPTNSDTALDCLMTDTLGCGFNNPDPRYHVQKYDVQQVDRGNAGKYCLPTDQTLRQSLMQNAKLGQRFNLIQTLTTIVLSMIISAGLSVLYLILTQCFPQAMNLAVRIIALICIFALGICMFFYTNDHFGGKIPMAIGLIILFILIMCSIFRNRVANRMNAAFLKASTQAVKSNFKTLLYIPFFMLLLTGFIILVIYEFRSYWTGGQLYFEPQTSIFYQFHPEYSIFLSILLIIQVIWGFSFLKQAFNFLVSGNGVSWYFNRNWSTFKPVEFLMCKHFGSVVAGSFMTAFFTIGDYIFDLLHPSRDHVVDGVLVQKPPGCYHRFFDKCCRPCFKLFELVRSDSLAYISIAGNPYCNAARYCSYLSDKSAALNQSQSVSRAYRLCAHFTIAAIAAIISIYVRQKIVPTALLVIVFMSLFISTFFISFHADIAEAIAISFVADEQYMKRETGDQRAKRSIQYSQFLRSRHQPLVAAEVDKILREEQISSTQKSIFSRSPNPI